MTAGTGLGAGAYLAGSAAFAVVVVAVAFGTHRLTRRLLPGWSGIRARLAEVVIALSVALLAAQLLGWLSALRPVPVFLVLTACGLAMVALAPRLPVPAPAPAAVTAPPPLNQEPVWQRALAAVAAALLTAQWVAHVVNILGRGMTHADTLWYHAPFAVRFVQRGSFSGLAQVGYAVARWLPFDSELVHALVMLPWHRDLLSPFVNLGWGALTIAAAWCIGRRGGCGALAVLGAVLVLALPTISGTQPGQASNDAMCAALMLVAVALLLDDDRRPIVVALAGAAAGISLSTRLVVVAPIAVLTVALVIAAVRARYWVAVWAWLGGLVVTGSYWFIRNIVGTGSPLPYMRLGPLHARVPPEHNSLASHLFNRDYWRIAYYPGLHRGLGGAWPLFLLAFVAAIVVLAWRGRPFMERAVAVAVVAGFVAYVFTPETGNLGFAFNLRYLEPVMLMAFTVVPLAIPDRRRGLAAAGYTALIAAAMTAAEHERVATWPGRAVLIGAVFGILVLACAVAASRGVKISAPLWRVGAGVVVVVVIAAGFGVQHYFFEHRYAHSGLFLDRANAFFRDVSHSSVAMFGAVEIYPMFGNDLSNTAAMDNIADTTRGDACTRWRSVRDGKYRYVMFTRFGVLIPTEPPLRWFTDDPASHEVLHDGPTRVFELSGPLHPAECQ
jgi:hypothetical protein